MKITPEQSALLNSFKCERLSSNPANMRLVDNFFNRRNSSLEYTLQNEAMQEDDEGSVAYYVIKDNDDNILFYFSLKSGSLYDSHFDINVIKLLKELNSFVQESLYESEFTEEQRAILNGLQEKIRSHKGITKLDLDNLPIKKEELFADLEKELNKNVTHVGKTYSGIELVHFCANNACDNLWESFGLPHSIGVVMFWIFIVDKIIEARNILGIQYLFLFAADLSEEDSLISYYSDKLEFMRDAERATVKPIYDLSCEFMYQEIKDLEDRRKQFLNNFNPDIEEV
ncbi:MAG: hypothetical protein K2L34_13480 [Muribaculaceae bacterium]|nr:hypothetical protein [Muribaculaceae bacterium]